MTLVFSVGLACFTVGVLVGGRVADRFAPRRVAVLTAVGVVAGLFGAGASRSLIVLIVAFGVVLGLSTGLGYATAVRVAGTVAARRGAILGLVVGAYAAGTAVVAPVAAVLLAATTLMATFSVLAATVGGLTLAGALLLPNKAPSPVALQKPRSVRERRAFRSFSGVIGLWIAFGLGSAPALTAFAHAGQVAGHATASALAVPLLSVGSLVGRLGAGAASDWVGRPTALHATAAALTAVCIVLGFIDQTGVRLTMLLMLGIQYGALSALVPAATADTVPKQRFGAAYGVVFTGWGLSGLVVPVAATAFGTSTGWDRVFLVFVGFAVVAWFAVVLAGRRACRDHSAWSAKRSASGQDRSASAP